MSTDDSAMHCEVRLAATRQALRRFLEAPDAASRPVNDTPQAGGFPRSQTMRWLCGSKGMTVPALLGLGLLAYKSRMARRLLSLLPVTSIFRFLQ